MKKLGIIGAMQQEVETLLGVLENCKTENRGGCTFYAGQLEGVEVVIVQCGVGKVNAAMCAQILCDRYEVTHIVNTGIAGSLCAELDIGDFVISQDAMYHDFTVAPLGYEVGQVPGLPVHSFPADETLRNAAMAAAQQVHPDHARIGRIASGDQFVAGKEQKIQIIADTGALCTEMEGAAIAHTAWRNGVPFVVIRAISDKADDSAEMDYPTFEDIAAKRCAAVTQTLAAALA